MISNLVYSLGGVILLEIIAFFLLYRLTHWLGKHCALMVAVVVVGIYIPIGVLTWKGLDYFAIHFAFFIMIPYVLGIITTHWEARRLEVVDGQRQRFFHWGPATLVVFFMCLATVDSFILSLAEKGLSGPLATKLLPEPKSQGEVVSLFPGAVSHDFQEKESEFNDYQQRLAEQQARGWQVRKGWLGNAVVNQSAVFKVAVADKAGQPLEGASISGRFLDSSSSRKDVVFTMDETAAGEFMTNVLLNQSGQWDVVFTVTRGDEQHEVRATTKIAPARDRS